MTTKPKAQKTSADKYRFEDWIVNRQGEVIRKFRGESEAARVYRDEQCPEGMLISVYLGKGREGDANAIAKANSTIARFVKGNFDFALPGESLDDIASWCDDDENPMAMALKFETQWFCEFIEEWTKGAVCTGVRDGLDGYRYEDGKQIPLTNEECCFRSGSNPAGVTRITD